jgi:hypothetical protein
MNVLSDDKKQQVEDTVALRIDHAVEWRRERRRYPLDHGRPTAVGRIFTPCRKH